MTREIRDTSDGIMEWWRKSRRREHIISVQLLDFFLKNGILKNILKPNKKTVFGKHDPMDRPRNTAFRLPPDNSIAQILQSVNREKGAIYPFLSRVLKAVSKLELKSLRIS